MPEQPRGLVVNDLASHAKNDHIFIRHGFEKMGWGVDCKVATSAVDAYRLVRDQAPFDFALVDFELGAKTPALGLIERLRSTAPGCYILVITARLDSYPNFEQLSLQAGANAAILRAHFSLDPGISVTQNSWDAPAVARRIRKHLYTHDWVDKLPLHFSETVELQSLLYRIGELPGEPEDALERGRNIVRKLILEGLGVPDEEVTSIDVHYLSSGNSGAHVCKVVRSRRQQARASFVMKISLHEKALEAEHAATVRAAEVLDGGTLVEYRSGVHKDAESGYTALVSRLARDAVTLRAWLGTPVGAAAARNVADELFVTNLGPLSDPSLRLYRPTLEWIATSPVHKLRSLSAVAANEEVWAHKNGGNIADAGDRAAWLRAWVNDGVLPDAESVTVEEQVAYVYAFGDLHSENVMVQTTGIPRPVLVDASEYGLNHWANDAARLLVDLVLRCRRTGFEAMLWTSVQPDAAYAGSLCRSCAPAADPGDEDGAVDAFVAQVVAKRQEYIGFNDLSLHESRWHWQWHVALAREFLRQGSRPGFMPQTTVVALTAAAEHLRLAADTLR